MHILHHFDKFTVFFVAVEASNRYSVAQVLREAEDLVINDESPSQVDTFKYVKILVERLLASVVYRLSMLSEKAMLDQSARWVYFVYDRVCIPVVPSCEDCDFVVDVGCS